ncbi:hypothetical protein AYO40_04425 [Planctomycetaceae bacterium SCGC AG-212-D15]|nr:hypothetical protein AYO40_04425 [Planctomycetaceae bacterium SCGC AG-212-D15]
MPLKLNVGASKKVGESNFGSKGASVHLEVEFDSSLVSEPAKLQEKIRQLFGLVRSSLNEELNGQATTKNSSPANGNGNGNGAAKPAPKARPATQSQVKAIYRIAQDRGYNLDQILREQFNLRKPEELSISQASHVIDHLKALQS